MRKQTIILALLNFEITHIKEIEGAAKTHVYDVVPARKRLRKRRRLNVRTTSLVSEPVSVPDNNVLKEVHILPCKGFRNFGSTCYLNRAGGSRELILNTCDVLNLMFHKVKCEIVKCLNV